MVQIQLRADRWVRNNYPQAFDWQGNYVSDAERLSLDSLDLVSSGTWQLSLSRSAGYDTLALVGFTKNFKQTRILFYSGPTGLITETIDAPRYVLPLENYHEFLSVPELDRVTSIVQNELMSIATSQYTSDGRSISSFSRQWHDSLPWPLFTPYLAGLSARRWSLDLGNAVYTAPNTWFSIHPSTARGIMENRESVVVISAGDTTCSYLTSDKQVTALEFVFQPEPMNWKYDGYGWNGYRTYSTTCHWVGLTFQDEPHSAIWMTKDDIVKSSGIPVLKGWFDAVFANELAKRLAEE